MRFKSDSEHAEFNYTWKDLLLAAFVGAIVGYAVIRTGITSDCEKLSGFYLGSTTYKCQVVEPVENEMDEFRARVTLSLKQKAGSTPSPKAGSEAGRASEKETGTTVLKPADQPANTGR